MTERTSMRMYVFTQTVMLLVLLLLLHLELLPALLGGLFVYFLIEFGARPLLRFGVIPATGRMLLLVAISAVLITLLVLGGVSLFSFLAEGKESLSVLMGRLADIVSTARHHFPAWARDYIPTSAEDWQHAVSQWLRDNAGRIGGFGRGVGVVLAHALVGMLIGGLIAVSRPMQSSGALGYALQERISIFGLAFRRIVFSQIKISALNTTLTAIFLGLVMPLMGTPLPFLKTIIVITFVVGLLPVIGNLISNSVICLIALSVSLGAAIAALIFLVVIHKLEYFVNAHIIGLQISARAWEILLAMLVLETAFGLPGVVAAPIYYAYIKDELNERGLV